MASMSPREFVTALHGLVLGAAFLLAFTGTCTALLGLRAEWTTPAGRVAGGRRLLAGATAMSVLAWATVLVGTLAVYPWYRAAPPPGTTAAHLAAYPKATLVASPHTARWHTLGMEWKEHVGWLAPFYATAVAAVAFRYRRTLARHDAVRRGLLVLLSAAFFAAGIAGLLGALINKLAPIH